MRRSGFERFEALPFPFFLLAQASGGTIPLSLSAAPCFVLWTVLRPRPLLANLTQGSMCDCNPREERKATE